MSMFLALFTNVEQLDGSFRNPSSYLNSLIVQFYLPEFAFYCKKEIPYEQAIVGGKSSLLTGRDQTQGGVVTCCYK